MEKHKEDLIRNTLCIIFCMTDNSQTKIYIDRIENRNTFKTKPGLLTFNT